MITGWQRRMRPSIPSPKIEMLRSADIVLDTLLLLGAKPKPAVVLHRYNMQGNTMRRFAFIFFIPLLLDSSLSTAIAYETCKGPKRNLVSYVEEKRSAELDLVVGNELHDRCSSPVSPRVTEAPEWQYVTKDKFLEVSLDTAGSVIELQMLPLSDVPTFLTEAAKKQGLRPQ